MNLYCALLYALYL